MDNFVKLYFDENELFLTLRCKRCGKDVKVKINKIMPTYLEVEISVLYDFDIRMSLYDNKEAITKCIRNYNFDDENLQRVSEKFEFEFIKGVDISGYSDEVMLTNELLIKKICLERLNNKAYIIIDFYNDIYGRGGKKKAEIFDVSSDTLYINYENYDSIDIRNDVSTLIKYRNQIEEFIINNEIIEDFLKKNICEFSFDKIGVHVEMINESIIFNTDSSIEEIKKLFTRKKLRFYNHVPKFICDGAPTFNYEFDNIEQIHNLIKTPEYLKENLSYYESIEKDILSFSPEYKMWGDSIIVLLSSPKYDDKLCVGYIIKNEGYDFDLKEMLEKFEV